MNQQEIINEINKLSFNLTARTGPKTNAKIAETAELAAPLLKSNGLQISKGGTSPSQTRSYQRVYLEVVGNTSHDSRHKLYHENVIRQWEWQTQQARYYTPISSLRIRKFCDELIAELREIEKSYNL